MGDAGRPGAGPAKVVPGRLRLRERPALLVACIAAPVVELVVLWASGLAGDRALAVQVSAPSPWGEFHDIRWALVLHDSWLTLALEAAGIWAVRSVLDAAIVWCAWPGADRPAFARQLRRSAIFTVATLIVLFPWAVIAFGVSVVSVSWLFFAAVPPVMVVALVIHHGPVARGWWHRIPPWRSVGWVALTFLVETLAGLILGVAPSVLWVPVTAAAGWFNAWAWRGVVGAVTGQVGRRRWVPLGPAVTAGMTAGAVLGAAISFAVVTGRHPLAPPPVPAADARGAPVLIVAGFGSHSAGADPHPLPGNFDEVRFSYRGLDPSGRPRPYVSADTDQSIAVLARLLAAQVQALANRTGRPVSIVAESEGALIARVYVASVPHAPVDHLILLSPLDQPGRVYYPAAGQQGYGLLPGWALDGLTKVIDGMSPLAVTADSPFLRSIVDHAADLRGLLSCPVPAVHEAMVVPLADAVADPAVPNRSIPAVIVPAFHGGLLTDRTAQRDVSRLLVGDTVSSGTVLADLEHGIRLAAAGWQVPPLPLSLYSPGGDDHPTCAAMTSAVESWVAGAP